MHPDPSALHGHYELHGVSLAVTCDEADIRKAVDDVLVYFGVVRRDAPASPASVHLEFLVHGPPPDLPAHAHRGLRHNGIDVYGAHGGFYLCFQGSVVHVDPASNQSRGVFSTSVWQRPGVIRIELVNLIIHSLLLLLRSRHFFPLHAACLAKDGEGVLLVAPSDSGKSTQAMNLVRAGWDYLSDDSVLLRPQGECVEAWPLRRDFGLDDKAETTFPEIRRHRSPFLTDERKQRIRMASIFPGQAADRCIPRLLVFPKIVDRAMSRLIPMDRTEAMFQLMQQSVLLTIDPHSAAGHVDVLRQLAEQTRSFELEAGTDVRDDTTLSARMLEPCLSVPT